MAFNGELAFTSMLLALANPQPLKAYFLQGHGEASLTSSENTGYQKFATVLAQNYIAVTNLNWVGNAGVPMDCNLLIIAAPDHALAEPELQAVGQYLREGGRLLLLFNSASQAHPTGLEPILQPWGVNVLDDIAEDAGHTMSKGYDVVVDQFGKHPVVNSLSSQLQLWLPRPILPIPNLPASAPEVDVLFGTSAEATLLGNRAEPPHNYPLACAIEQKPVAGTVSPRGNTRIIVVGDSIFLGNTLIESGGNRDFLTAAVNWLCDRPMLVAGIGPRPVTEFRLLISNQQQRQLELAAARRAARRRPHHRLVRLACAQKMKTKTTALWFVLAAALATAIWVVEKYFQPAAPAANGLLAGLHADQVTGIEIYPAGAPEISVSRTNKTWQLEKPFAYPAQAAAIDGLLGALEKLAPVTSLTAAEMSGRKDADAEFGFENPQFTLDINAGEQSWHLRVGKQTAPGDGVYVRVVGAAGAFVTDTGWLQYLRRDATDWRDTTLVDIADTVDWIVITNGANIELRRDVTNRLWRMIRPYPARADGLRIITALQQLRSAKVSQFVSDDPKPDLAGYGLAPAALDVWLGHGTNFLTAIHVGKDAPGTPGQVFARREGWNAVVTTAKEPLAPWRGAVNDFRDPRLVELTAPVAEIEVRGENNFTLQRRGSNDWAVAGETFPVDAANVRLFIQQLATLTMADIVKDVVTGPGLQSYGLTNPPARQITLRSVVGDTNSTIAQLLFGAATTNQVYVKRSDEDCVYALALADLGQLPATGLYFRERRIWNFSEAGVTNVTLRQNGKMAQLVRTGTNQWSVAAGSAIINPLAVEETIHQLGGLTVAGWIGHNFTAAEAEQFGLNTNNLSIAIELKSGEKYALDFGGQLDPRLAQTALAAVTLEGERWAFVFPPVIYPLVSSYLTISTNAP